MNAGYVPGYSVPQPTVTVTTAAPAAPLDPYAQQNLSYGTSTVQVEPKKSSPWPHFTAAWFGLILAIIAIILAMIAIFMNPTPGMIRYWGFPSNAGGSATIKSQIFYDIKGATAAVNSFNFTGGKQGSYFFVWNNSTVELILNYNGKAFATLAANTIAGFAQLDNSSNILPVRTAERA